MAPLRACALLLALCAALLWCGTASAQLQKFAYTGPAIFIPDFGFAPIGGSAVQVSATGYVSNIRLTLEGFAHNEPADLFIVLVAPDGEYATMTAQCGSCAFETDELIFSDDAYQDFDEFTQNFCPQDPREQKQRGLQANDEVYPSECILSRSIEKDQQRPPSPNERGGGPFPFDWSYGFDSFYYLRGVQANGEWRLWIYDAQSPYNGTLASWFIELEVQQCPHGSIAAQTSRGYHYCLCRAGYAGDACNIELVTCDWENGCYPEPTECTAMKPVRCPSGVCEADTALCAPCRPDGNCAAIAPLCPFLHVRCPDGSCQEDAEVCEDVVPCDPGSSYSSGSGGTGVICADGVCREEQDCPIVDDCEFPAFRCPNMRCTTDIADCRGRCNLGCELECWDGTCVLDAADCTDPPSIRRAAPFGFYVFDQERTVDILHDTGDSLGTVLASFTANGNTFAGDDVVEIVVDPAILNEVRASVGDGFGTQAFSSIIAFTLQPPEAQFADALLVTFRVRLPLGVSPSDVSLRFVDENRGRWVAVKGGLQVISDLGGGVFVLQAKVTHFTNYAVLVNDEGKGSDSSDDDWVVPVAVLVPIAALAVVGASSAGFAFFAYKKRERLRKLTNSAKVKASLDDDGL